ncbi:MAG: acyl-CoA dehydrogenase [Deltaproteobacteria bacterium RBG_19FT_COMBO_52_11]|nr:MAG: acyl-CoA dehydrogenase [Deltaproteobacteria bacterium RBG_19FT_COMBO_52_11]
MDFKLSEELQAIRETARDFAEKEIVPYADKWDAENYFPREVVKKMAGLGFYGTLVPEEYGGNGMGFLAGTIITEEIARASASLRVTFNMQTFGPALSILRYGNEEQKKKYISKLASTELISCFGITEPNAGSDIMALKTTAIPKGDHFVVNGAKTWISNAQIADLCVLYAYSDPAAKSKGLSTFLLDMHLPGISTRPLDKMGLHSAPTGEIFLEDVKVPRDALLGNLGDGVKHVFGSLNQTRLSCAAGGLGIAQACLEASVKYCNERVQFGQQIGQFQMNQDMIAIMATELEAARFLVYRAAVQKDEGFLGNVLETSMAKYYAAEVAGKAADFAMRILSAYGYSTEYPVARYYRDAKSVQIVEGTANIQKTIIALDQLGYRKANR